MSESAEERYDTQAINLFARVVDICDQFELEFQQDLTPRIEDYLSQSANSIRPALLRELIALELELRRGRGERPDPAEYRGRFPDDDVFEQAFATPSFVSDSLEASLGSRAIPRPMIGELIMTGGNQNQTERVGSVSPDSSDDRPALEDTLAESFPDPFPSEFAIRDRLGEGAFGTVWLADDINLGRRVALKALKAVGQEQSTALRREAQLLAELHHPNVVRIHAWRESGGIPYLVLQYVPGGSFANKLYSEGALAWDMAARYVADIGEGLLAAHQLGIIHRDIKPANILWHSGRDEALLTDFGLSARLAEHGGIAGGTPAYMAREAFEGVVSESLDVYSLSATLFHLVTGHVPYPASRWQDLPGLIERGLPDDDERCVGVPEPLERAIRAGLVADPRDRPGLIEFVATIRGTLNQLLADALAGRPDQRRGLAQVGLSLNVSRRATDHGFKPIVATRLRTPMRMRDMKKVPPTPDQVRIRTGEHIRIEVVADRPGFVTVFNVGPTGNLNLLHPYQPGVVAPPVEANRPLHVLDIELTPPVGRERVFAVWSQAPLAAEYWIRLADEGKSPGLPSYHATRDMKRLAGEVQQLDPQDWCSVVLELDHC